MNPDNKRKRQEIRQMQTMQEYNTYLNSLKLTTEQREIMNMIYINGYAYQEIGDKLGYRERTIKQKVKKIFDLL